MVLIWTYRQTKMARGISIRTTTEKSTKNNKGKINKQESSSRPIPLVKSIPRRMLKSNAVKEQSIQPRTDHPSFRYRSARWLRLEYNKPEPPQKRDVMLLKNKIRKFPIPVHEWSNIQGPKPWERKSHQQQRNVCVN